jgi:diguanylate cyclase (GGDEF)-like protein/PAS domain S-box-containing protein
LRSFWLLAVGLWSLLVADALYGYFTLNSSFSEHTFVDIGWIVFYMTWGAAALHPSMRSVTDGGPSTRSMSPKRLSIVGSAVLVPPLMLFAQDAVGDVSDATPIALTGAWLFVLVLIRIVGIVRSAANARSETRIRALVDKSSDAILVVDGEARIRYHSAAAERIFARNAADLDEAFLTDLLRVADAQNLRVILSNGSPTTNVEWRVRPPDGKWRDLEVVADDLRGTAEVNGLVLTLRDVTRRKQLDMELRHQALHDSLTGLPNRVLFMDRVEQAMRRAERRGGSVTVLFLDLDDFKLINDSLGHGAGDSLLIAVAARLLASIRAGDTLARLGGDEFGFLLDTGEVEEGEATANRIEHVLREPFVVGDKLIQLWASTGIAAGSLRIKTPDDLLRDAELAMYLAKRNGKNRFELFRPEMHDDATRRLDIAAELLGGMERNELFLHYQPIVDIHSGAIVGIEALVRWQHPRRGFLPPDEFIPIAETTGLIAQLDKWVLNEACGQVAAWKSEHRCDESFYISVNVSGRHLQDRNLTRDVRDALAVSGLDAGSLVLEVTETALIDDVESATAILARLKEIGVRIAVDDFGTGYSSLTHLVKFPLDIVKIDKSFVDRVANGNGGDVMVRAVIDLSHKLGLATVAEGVEVDLQALALEDLACRWAQGYLYSRPVPAEDMAALLDARHLPATRQKRGGAVRAS